MSEEDLKEHEKLAKELTEEDVEKVAGVVDKMKALIAAEVEQQQQQPNNNSTSVRGLSLLELKNMIMLEYLTDLTLLAAKKCAGISISGAEGADGDPDSNPDSNSDPVLDRIVTARTVLEKMRPIEQKIRYQVDKAVKVAESGKIESDDPMHFKANPDAFVSKLDHDDDDDDDNSSRQRSSGQVLGKKYVVPKHVPTYYNEDNDGGGGRGGGDGGGDSKAKKQQLSRTLIEDLKRQHLETPEEIWAAAAAGAEDGGATDSTRRKKRVQEARERIRYEEEHFTRLPMKKKERNRIGKGARMSTVASIGDEVTAFGRNNYFNAKSDSASSLSKRRATTGSGSGGRGGTTKRRKFRK